MKSAIAVAALVATSLSFAAILPATAQDAPAAPSTPPAASTPAPTPDTARPAHPMHQMHHRMMRRGGMQRGGGGLLAAACSAKGPAILQHLLDRSAKRLDLSADQQKLFDTFRTTALSAETTFSDSCKADMPAKGAGRADLPARLKAGLAVDQARITALTSVLPDFTAFYASLSADQQAKLPRMMRGMGQGGQQQWSQGQGQRQHGKWGHGQQGQHGQHTKPATPPAQPTTM
jgi:hypothetical protein